MAKTVVFDFDGVIHSYTSGWQGEDTIPDPPVTGIREALKEIHDAGYEVVVVSTRCATIKGHGAIEAWLYDNGLREYIDKVCKEKPPAVAYIDDRAICFDGHPETLLKKIQNFLPWYKKPTITPPNEPLTLDELREMDGEPVWVGEVEHWALIDVEKGGQWDGMPFAVWAENGAKFTYNIMNRNLHCYRRPPEGEEDT